MISWRPGCVTMIGPARRRSPPRSAISRARPAWRSASGYNYGTQLRFNGAPNYGYYGVMAGASWTLN
jgi:hypothetical protein